MGLEAFVTSLVMTSLVSRFGDQFFKNSILIVTRDKFYMTSDQFE
jgi:hypothetical protein